MMFACVPLEAFAQDYLAQYRGAADQCIATVDARGGEAECEMKVFSACNLGEPIEICMRAEAEFWAEKLEPELAGALLEMARQDDMQPALQSRHDALAASQAAWADYQDASCRLAELTTGSAAYCLASNGFARVMYLIELQEPLQ